MAIVGCGRIADLCHLPAVLSSPHTELSALADTRIENATALREKYALRCRVVADYRDLHHTVDAAIIATPNATHYEIAEFFLTRGISVLVEKPLVLTTDEARRLIGVAERKGCICAVGYVTRLFPSTVLMKKLLDERYFGDVTSFSYEFGSAGGWAPVSGYNLDRAQAGGGVLVVSGTHFLDRMIYWFGVPEIMHSSSDSHGGPEANFRAQLAFKEHEPRITGSFHVSKTYKLRNQFHLHGTRYDAILPEGQSEWLLLKDKTVALPLESRTSLLGQMPPNTAFHYFTEQVTRFAECIMQGKASYLDGPATIQVVKLVEDLYRLAQPMPEAWRWQPRRTGRQAPKTSKQPKILITGASGFVGGALCEHLYFGGEYEFRAMVRNTGRAARIARMPLEIAQADLLNKTDLARAVTGCNAIVNLARGGKLADTYGLVRLLDAALREGIDRFVHVSSVAVYGDDPPPESTSESWPPRPGANKYGQVKLKQEEILQRYVKKGIGVIILRPPNIYGPWSQYTTALVEKIIRGEMALIDKGANPCNVVHVYNLVHAIMLALKSQRWDGDKYFITDDSGITWREFLEAHLRIIGQPIALREVELREEDMPQVKRETRKMTPGRIARFLASAEVRGLLTEHFALCERVNTFVGDRVRVMSPERQRRIERIVARPGGEWARGDLRVAFGPLLLQQRRRVAHSCERARRELGYRPVLSFSEAMENTAMWLRMAGLI